MSARSYLSIGDVLTLLRQEFPDVTISKIRFLESQGLVNPERTPSGYRKFYQHDVERLRWVLRQQREHFLPLKVIKDRLDGDPGESAAAESTAAESTAAESSHRAAASSSASSTPEYSDPTSALEGRIEPSTDERRTKEPVLVGHRVSTEHGSEAAGSGGRRAVASTLVDDGPTLPGIESAVAPSSAAAGSKTAAAGSSDEPTHHSASSAGGSSASRTRAPDRQPGRSAGLGVIDDGGPSGRAGSKSEPVGPTGATSTGSASRRSRTSPAESTPSGPKSSGTKSRPSATTGSESSRPGSTRRGAPPAGNGSTDAPGSAAKAPGGSDPIDLSGASLSADELSAACGLDVAHLRELQEYGLLTSDNVAGVECFGEEALAVANLAAQFAQFGIEPRHLRLYRNAAEREAGFVEQIVLPLVRQRNPEARARAHETADELARLGQQLRASLLRSALGNLLNG
jgi:DNA-binding transcriptional MerR regulator